MKWSSALLALAIATPEIVSAGGHVQGRAQDALGNAQVFNDYSVPDAEDVLNQSIDTDLDVSSMNAQQLEDAGVVATAADTVGAGTFEVMNTNAVPWSIQSAPHGGLGLADAAVSDPDLLTPNTSFTSDGGICTVTEFSDAPPMERVCDLTREHGVGTVTETADITVFRTELFQCTLVGTGAACGELIAAPNCSLTSQVCTLSDVDGACIEEIADYTCVSDAPMAFAAPQIGPTTWDAPIVNWTTSQSANYAPQSCVLPETTCPGGATVQDVNGLLVPMDCMAEVTSYDCALPTYSMDHCAPFEDDPGCTEIASECYDDDPDGVCGTFERTYQCGGGQTMPQSAECTAVNVCVSDYCQAIEPEADANLPQSLAAIDLLNNMADEWHETEATFEWQFVEGQLRLVLVPGGELAYFNSLRRTCRKSIFGALNCCSNSGWAVGTLTQCSEGELALHAANIAGTTVYMRTYCSSRALFACIERRREYCVFNSKIAREVNFQAQHQLYGAFDCRGLLHAEMEQLDWNQIDLSPVYEDLLGNMQMLNGGTMSGLLSSNILLQQPQVVGTYE